jgi:hypothetical protein
MTRHIGMHKQKNIAVLVELFGIVNDALRQVQETCNDSDVVVHARELLYLECIHNTSTVAYAY